MEFTEYPLLHIQDLMLTVLRAGTREDATIEDCIASLHGMLRLAGESPPVTDDEIREHLIRVKFHLMKAGLVMSTEREHFATTERGRHVLQNHPHGVDESVLMEFPEYRRYIEQSGNPPAFPAPNSTDDRSGPEIVEYDEGLAAFRDGRTLADNPYEWDIDKHLAWENGWSQSRDEELRGREWRKAKSYRMDNED
ncbi:MAG TPA: hypothetical protein VK943_11100 [Arenibaculum sp.]|nr:hypothetical protein [Arenibaculum sp.]